MELVDDCTAPNILLTTVCIQETYDMFEMNGDLEKKKKKIKKKERLEGMKKEMDIVSDELNKEIAFKTVFTMSIEDNLMITVFQCKIVWYMDNSTISKSIYFCLPLQDDHEITIEELEMRYNTSVSKVGHLK